MLPHGHECNAFCRQTHPEQHCEVVYSPETNTRDAYGTIRYAFGVLYDCWVERVQPAREYVPLSELRHHLALDPTHEERVLGLPAPGDAPAWLVTYRTDYNRARTEWEYENWINAGRTDAPPYWVQRLIDGTHP